MSDGPKLIFATLLLSAVALSLVPGPARAELRFDQCTIETDLTPDHIRALGDKYAPKVSLRICSLNGHPEGYFVLSPPWKGTEEVCHYESQELYPKQAPDGTLILIETEDPNQSAIYQTEYMLASKAPCPSPAKQRYVRARPVTEGLFLLMNDLWQTVATNKRGLDAVCNVVDAKARSGSIYKSFAASLKGGGGYLDGIGLMNWQAQSEPPNQFMLRIGGLIKAGETADPSQAYILYVDFIGSKLCVTGIGGVTA